MFYVLFARLFKTTKQKNRVALYVAALKLSPQYILVFFFIYLFSFLYLVVDKFLKQKRGTSENKNRILEMFFF